MVGFSQNLEITHQFENAKKYITLFLDAMGSNDVELHSEYWHKIECDIKQFTGCIPVNMSSNKHLMVSLSLSFATHFCFKWAHFNLDISFYCLLKF